MRNELGHELEQVESLRYRRGQCAINCITQWSDAVVGLIMSHLDITFVTYLVTSFFEGCIHNILLKKNAALGTVVPFSNTLNIVLASDFFGGGSPLYRCQVA